jgi:hypothetical protein
LSLWGDKPIMGCVVWSQTIFRFFEFFCEDASQNKLRVSENFMILGATVQKLWEFEVFRWTLGRAGMCWNQPARVDYLRKKWRAAQKKRKKKGQVLFFFSFSFFDASSYTFVNFLLEVWGMGQRFWENGCKFC